MENLNRIHENMESMVEESEWSIEISHNRMEAVLHVKPGFQVQWRLKDRGSNYHSRLDIVEEREFHPIPTDHILDKLKQVGVTVGISFKEIMRACCSEQPGSFIIAHGIEPEEGRNGAFVPLRELAVKKGFKVRMDGTIDYRELQEIPSVTAGQIIGIIESPMIGKPGLSVTGDPVFPPEVHPIRVLAGQGAEVIDELKVVATEAGQPVLVWSHHTVAIQVSPTLTISKDVDLSLGNVRYAGDVRVLGSVQDGMTVEAKGTIDIQSNVNMGTVIAGRSITVHRNVITSKLTAGRFSFVEQELHQMLGKLYEQAFQLKLALEQIAALYGRRMDRFYLTGLGPLLRLLCVEKFTTFLPLIFSLCDKVTANESILDPEWKELSDKLIRNIVEPHHSDIRTLEEFDSFVQGIERKYKSLPSAELETDCLIRANYLQNSRVYSTGDIQIVGEGVYSSELYAKGFIQIDGFVRGGDIYGEKGVRIREAGTRGGLATKIRVPAGQCISIDFALENTYVQIGAQEHAFLTDANFVRVNPEGQLEYHS
jgi:uncharacterized protein